MRQVPHYLLIGNGCLANHFKHYFRLLDLPFSSWHRALPLTALAEAQQAASTILVLIRDDAIETFIQTHLQNTKAHIVHCSGSLITDLAVGAHPLTTFNQGEYSLEKYQQFGFVIDDDAPPFNVILPGVPNAHVRLPKQQKMLYHALCAMAGNFSCLLWQKFLSTLQNQFNIPEEIALPYLKQQTDNLITHAATALTGPLVRGDTQTLEKHLIALKDDPFHAIYQQFIQTYSLIKE